MLSAVEQRLPKTKGKGWAYFLAYVELGSIIFIGCDVS